MEDEGTTAGSPPCWSAAVSSRLTPRLDLGGLVGGGTLLVRFGGGPGGRRARLTPRTACHPACRRTCGPSSSLLLIDVLHMAHLHCIPFPHLASLVDLPLCQPSHIERGCLSRGLCAFLAYTF